MKRQVVIATLGAMSAAAVCVAAPTKEQPVGLTDRFDIGNNPAIEEPALPGHLPPAVEFGPGGTQPGTPVAAPLPGPALMGAVGLGALLSIRRRWTERN